MRADDSYSQQVLVPVIAAFETGSPPAFVSERLFIASFSEERDELGQWRAYAADGVGYAIGLRPRCIDLDAFKPSMVAAFVKVVYDPATIDTFIVQLLDLHQRTAAVAPDVARTQLLNALGVVRPIFKHRAYEHEQEWRLAILTYEMLAQGQVKARRGRSLMIPYVETPIPRGTPELHSFEEIVLGPTLDSERARIGLAQLLSLILPEHPVAIGPSLVPYRPRS